MFNLKKSFCKVKQIIHLAIPLLTTYSNYDKEIVNYLPETTIITNLKKDPQQEAKTQQLNK